MSYYRSTININGNEYVALKDVRKASLIAMLGILTGALIGFLAINFTSTFQAVQTEPLVAPISQYAEPAPEAEVIEYYNAEQTLQGLEEESDISV